MSLTKLSAHGKGPDADPGLFGGEDRLYGNGGADNFVGGAGNDHLFGGDGNDIPTATDGEKDEVFDDAGADIAYTHASEIAVMSIEDRCVSPTAGGTSAPGGGGNRPLVHRHVSKLGLPKLET